MQDMITKGDGNSRFLKTSLAPGASWDEALAQMIAGTFPVDFNGTNPDGILQEGTPLTKANLLSDDTATAIGDNVNTPNEALNKLQKLISDVEASANTKAKIALGTYRGNGGAEKDIQVGFAPKILICGNNYGYSNSEYYSKRDICIYYGQYQNVYGSGFYVRFSEISNGLRISATGNVYAMNDTNADYLWIAIA